MTQVVLKTGPGDLVLTRDGATYRPYTLHGSPPAGEFWSMAQGATPDRQ